MDMSVSLPKQRSGEPGRIWPSDIEWANRLRTGLAEVGIGNSIIALDPGGTTGVAIVDISLESVIDAYQIGPDAHHMQLYNLLYMLASDPLIVICESFQFRQFKDFDKTKVELMSVEYIGVVKLVKQVVGNSLTHVEQTASMAKDFVTDQKLKALGLWQPGKPHANDALRHLIRYLVVNLKMREPIVDTWLDKLGVG